MDFGWIEYEEMMVLGSSWRKRRKRRLEGKA
jgi:hypothetical protein